VSVPAAAEQRAYAALENGTPLEALITQPMDKPRNDEAMLAREHLSDTALGDAAESARSDRVAPAKPGPPAPFDPVLQRAVQLHRALVALKRVSPA
jgi:hypothetical protein